MIAMTDTPEDPGTPETMNGVELIRAERHRQVTDEGWTAEHDDQHVNEEIAIAAGVYALPDHLRDLSDIGLDEVLWPWDYAWWKPTPDNRVRELVKAGALIAAEIDRLGRLQ